MDTVANGVLRSVPLAVVAIVMGWVAGLLVLSLGRDVEIPEPIQFIPATVFLILMLPAISQLFAIVPLWISARRAGHRRRALGVLCCAAGILLLNGAYCGLEWWR